MAPPFPYVIAGSIIDANGPMVVFTDQQQNFVVRPGEVLERTYRLESIEPNAVMLTYIPLGLRQRVPMVQ